MQRSLRAPLTITPLLILTLGVASTSHAYLGGFESDDGYASFLNDVTKFNAGQYGVNAGGGSFTAITPGTGLWTKLQGPLYPATGTAGGVAYATGHQNYDRDNPLTPDQALVITTNADGWGGGPQEYAYQLDSFDLGGVNPATTAGDTIDLSFWSCSRIFGTGEGGGLGPGTIGNAVSFYDSTGALGFSVGYQQPGTTTDVAATNVGVWNPSAVTVNPSAYHRWDVSLDLTAQTVSIDIFEGAVLTNLVTAAPLINPMANFTDLRFLGTPGVTNNKIWSLDDFGFSVRPVPEPAAMSLLLAAACGLASSRRRR